MGLLDNVRVPVGLRVRRGPKGVHLFDRNTGLNILLDGEVPPPEMWSRAPRYLSMALTNACELECAYCYASKLPARLPFDSVVEWAQEMDEGGGFGVGFGGGEPTLYPRFTELCRTVATETGLAVTVTTHGHRFNASLASRLTGHLHFIRLSVDGVGATYERLRGRPFSQLIEKMEIIRDVAPFGVNYVVNADTIGDLERAADFAFENGATEFLLLPELGPSGSRRTSQEVLGIAAAWARRNYVSRRVATSVQGAALMNLPALPISDDGRVGGDFMHIDAFGMMKACAFDESGLRIVPGKSFMDTVERLRSTPKVGQTQ